MNKLKELREEKQLYQKDIAKIINMSREAYAQYEREVNDIPTEILKKLASFHKTSIDYILDYTNERKPYPRKKEQK